jgi:hypothetical protein
MPKFRIVLRRPMSPAQPNRDRKWRELATDQPTLPLALAWAYQQLAKTSPENVAQVSSVTVTLDDSARPAPIAEQPKGATP